MNSFLLTAVSEIYYFTYSIAESIELNTDFRMITNNIIVSASMLNHPEYKYTSYDVEIHFMLIIAICKQMIIYDSIQHAAICRETTRGNELNYLVLNH